MIGSMMNAHSFFHPYAILSVYWSGILGYLVLRTKGDLLTFFDALNHLADQWMAIVVIAVGCLMLVMCKQYGLDSTIAGGIIGVGSNMLQNRLKEQKDTGTPPPIAPVP